LIPLKSLVETLVARGHGETRPVPAVAALGRWKPLRNPEVQHACVVLLKQLLHLNISQQAPAVRCCRRVLHVGMTPEAAAGLRSLAEALPAGAAVPVPREWLLELLDAQGTPAVVGTSADPTVEEIATRYGRALSTIRGWCEAGRFPGAYKLHDREWRIPAAALEAFDAQQRRGDRASGRRGSCVSLSDWRTG
jgi:helix-turn-helix protein